MIKARMIKAVRTQEDITYTLKGEPDKAAQHQAVDFEGETCSIELFPTEIQKENDPLMDILNNIIAGVNAGLKVAFVKGEEKNRLENDKATLIMRDVIQMEEKQGMCQFPDMNRDGLD